MILMICNFPLLGSDFPGCRALVCLGSLEIIYIRNTAALPFSNGKLANHKQLSTNIYVLTVHCSSSLDICIENHPMGDFFKCQFKSSIKVRDVEKYDFSQLIEGIAFFCPMISQ